MIYGEDDSECPIEGISHDKHIFTGNTLGVSENQVPSLHPMVYHHVSNEMAINSRWCLALSPFQMPFSLFVGPDNSRFILFLGASDSSFSIFEYCGQYWIHQIIVDLLNIPLHTYSLRRMGILHGNMMQILYG